MRYAILDTDSKGTAYPPHGASKRAHLMNHAAKTRRSAGAWHEPRYAYNIARERVSEARMNRRQGGLETAPAAHRPRAAREYPAYVVLCAGVYIVSDGFTDLYATDSEAEAEAVAHTITMHRARSWDLTR